MFYLKQSGVVMKFSNAVCKSLNESLIIIHTCRIRAINRYTNIFNYNATTLYPVNDVKGRFQVLKRENGYKPWLYDLYIDLCQYLRKPNNPALIFMFNQIKNFTNFFDQKCPISVSHVDPYVIVIIIEIFIFSRGLKQ